MDGSRLDEPPAELAAFVGHLLTDEKVDPAVIRLALRLKVAAALPSAVALIDEQQTPLADRVALIEAVGATNHEECVPRILACLTPNQPAAIQSAALTALQSYTDETIAEALVAKTKTKTPTLHPRLCLSADGGRDPADRIERLARVAAGGC